MAMMTQTVDLNRFRQRARQIRARVPAMLSQLGLPARFDRWRLTQDPDSGMVVLFAVLNSKYIATHTSTPLSDFFAPRLLHDLADDLQVQVVSCHSDGLRYAFILDRGQIDVLPTHIDFPFLDGDRLFVRVVYGDKPVPEVIEAQVAAHLANDQTLVHQGVEAFLKVFDDIRLKDDAASILSAQGSPDVVVVDEEEFNKRVAEHEADRQRSSRIRRLFGRSAQKQ
jgi:hypothetical protein